jgi:mono/diheme cytochrome c family protein
MILALTLLLALQAGDRKGENQPPPDFPVPPAPVVAPADALKTFKVAPGFRLELVAAEPLVEDPVQIAFDPAGRLWVVEMRGYMPDVDARGEDAPVGVVAVLEDTDGDGRMDRRTVFLDKLVLPRAIAFAGDGVLVTDGNALNHVRDADGDLKPDAKILVDPAYCNARNIEHTSNGLLRGIDNWYYNANSARRYRRAPDGRWIQGSTRSRGQWGIAQDDLGRLYANSNSDFLRGDLVPCFAPQAHTGKDPAVGVQIVKDQSTYPVRVNPGVNRGYQKGTLRPDGTLARCTAACAPHVYRGDAYPAEFRGNLFICEPAGNLVTRRLPDGRHAYDKAEFLASTDERFRPVQLTTGPDGCLYAVDLYRGILQHRPYVTTFLRRQILERGLDKPVGLGRIYRLVHESAPAPKRTLLAGTPPATLVERLSHPNGWVRDTAQRLLAEKFDPVAAAALKQLALEAKAPLVTRLHALFALEGLGKVDPAALTALEAASDPTLRLAALSVKEGGGLLDLLAYAALEAPLGPAELDRLKGKELDFFEKVMANEAWETEKSDRAELLRTLAARVAVEARPDRVAELFELAACQAVAARWRRRALLEGLRSLPPIRLPARSAALVKLSFAEDDARKLLARVDWPGKAASEPAPPAAAPLTADEQARWVRGKRQFAASCAVCHSLSGLGEEGKGPPFVDSDWVLGSEERLVRIVLQGLHGPIHVNGKPYPAAEMPAVLTMSNDEIAEALTYLRREWGHQAPPVSPESVKRIRAATADREEAWTEKELLKVKE